MSIDQASPLVPIKPQVALQNSAFIKNSHNRSSFCGVSPSPTNGTLKTFAVNRKSWSGNVSVPLQQYTPDDKPQLATFRSGTGTFPRNRERNNNSALLGTLTPNGNSVQSLRASEVRRGCANGRRYAEIGNWSKRWVDEALRLWVFANSNRKTNSEALVNSTSLKCNVVDCKTHLLICITLYRYFLYKSVLY